MGCVNTPKRIATRLVNKYGADFAHEIARQRVSRAIERRDDGWLYLWHRIALLIELSGRGVNWT